MGVAMTVAMTVVVRMIAVTEYVAARMTAISTKFLWKRIVTDRLCRLRRQCQDRNREIFRNFPEQADVNVKINDKTKNKESRIKVRFSFCNTTLLYSGKTVVCKLPLLIVKCMRLTIFYKI